MRQLLLCFLVFALCVSAQQSLGAEKLRVLSSIRPLGLLVESLAGEWVESEVLLRPGDSPHHLALRVSQLEKLQGADLVFWVGPEFERFLVRPLARRDAQVSLSTLSAGSESANSHDHQAGERHLWLDPAIVREAARALGAELIRLAPERKQDFNQALESFLVSFDDQDAALRARYAKLDGAFISWHPAFGEYVSAYNLKQIGSLIEGSEHAPGARGLVELKQKASQASCLLVDVQEFQAAKHYASLLGLAIEKVDILGANPELENWFEYYQGFADSLTRCLGKE